MRYETGNRQPSVNRTRFQGETKRFEGWVRGKVGTPTPYRHPMWRARHYGRLREKEGGPTIATSAPRCCDALGGEGGSAADGVPSDRPPPGRWRPSAGLQGNTH